MFSKPGDFGSMWNTTRLQYLGPWPGEELEEGQVPVKLRSQEQPCKFGKKKKTVSLSACKNMNNQKKVVLEEEKLMHKREDLNGTIFALHLHNITCTHIT